MENDIFSPGMVNALQTMLNQSFIYMIFVTTVLILLFKLSKVLNVFLKKRIAKKRIAKYKLENYDVGFDINGIPSTLVSKKDNKVIYI